MIVQPPQYKIKKLGPKRISCNNIKEMKQQQQQLVGRVTSAIKKPGNLTPNTPIMLTGINNEITGL